MLIGMAYQLAEQPERRSAYFAALWDSERIPPHIHLGDALRRQGRYDEAVIAYQRATTIDSNAIGAHIRLANMSARFGQVYRRKLPDVKISKAG